MPEKGKKKSERKPNMGTTKKLYAQFIIYSIELFIYYDIKIRFDLQFYRNSCDYLSLEQFFLINFIYKIYIGNKFMKKTTTTTTTPTNNENKIETQNLLRQNFY